MTVRDYLHSRPLDVHRWSNHQEVERFVNNLFDDFLIVFDDFGLFLGIFGPDFLAIRYDCLIVVFGPGP